MRQTSALVMVAEVARGFADLLPNVTFVGGAVIGLYLDDTSVMDVRVTDDVDCVVEAAVLGPMYRVEERLRNLGFANDVSGDAPLCRWIYHDLKVDVIPTDDGAYGFTNRWYSVGVRNRVHALVDNVRIQVFPLSIFLACKFEAFLDRGKADYMASHDWEDIVMLLAESNSLEPELASTSPDVRDFLRLQANKVLHHRDRDEAIFAHLDRDGLERQRLVRVLRRLEMLQSK